MPEEDKTPVNRFYRHSRVWPGQFKQDWNRSFVLLPLGKRSAAAWCSSMA
ncbi:hypothetical protein MJ588_18990 [Klebsiella pneumoniae]|nr:hypothetical protein MJ588_18990 [Klebsiella pneumoniae]